MVLLGEFMMVVINKKYRQWLESHPEDRVAVIIKTSEPPADHLADFEAHNLTVTQVFKFVSAVAACGPAKDVLALPAALWVVSIEPDRPVHTAL